MFFTDSVCPGKSSAADCLYAPYTHELIWAPYNTAFRAQESHFRSKTARLVRFWPHVSYADWVRVKSTAVCGSLHYIMLQIQPGDVSVRHEVHAALAPPRLWGILNYCDDWLISEQSEETPCRWPKTHVNQLKNGLKDESRRGLHYQDNPDILINWNRFVGRDKNL